MSRTLPHLAALALTIALPSLAAAGTVHFTAHTLDGATLLYTGEQTVSTAGGTVTERVAYHAPDGTRIFEREGSYRADTLEALAYQATDHRLGLEESVRRTNGGLEIRFRKDREHKEKHNILPSKGTQLLSLSIPALIRREWDRLATGEQVTFDLIVPSRTGTVGFRVQRTGAETVDGAPASVFRMEPSGWLVRKIVDPMFFFLADAGEHPSVRFRGRGVVPTETGHPLPVRVNYLPEEE